jgi:hypothetical protein
VSCQVEENLRHSNDSLSLSRKEYDSLRRKVKTKRGIADAAKEVGPSSCLPTQSIHCLWVDESMGLYACL